MAGILHKIENIFRIGGKRKQQGMQHKTGGHAGQHQGQGGYGLQGNQRSKRGIAWKIKNKIRNCKGRSQTF
jgi:hypothetical protein